MRVLHYSAVFFLTACIDSHYFAPRHIYGVVGGSAVFCIEPAESLPFRGKIDWLFSSDTTDYAFWFAELKDGKHVPSRYGHARFAGRVRSENFETLRIDDLVAGDSGLYTAKIFLTKSHYVEDSVRLSVFDSLQDARLWNVTGECTVTARCHVPSNTSVATEKSVTVSWRIGNSSMSVCHHRSFLLSENGRELYLFGQANFTESKFACFITSSDGRRNVSSFGASTACDSVGVAKKVRSYTISIVVFGAFGLLIGVSLTIVCVDPVYKVFVLRGR